MGMVAVQILGATFRVSDARNLILAKQGRQMERWPKNSSNVDESCRLQTPHVFREKGQLLGIHVS